MQALNDMQAATHSQNPANLVYGQNHFNAVWYNTEIKTKGNNKMKMKRKKENKQTSKNTILKMVQQKNKNSNYNSISKKTIAKIKQNKKGV